jgi:mannose-1-phosphate guanylyltransferase
VHVAILAGGKGTRLWPLSGGNQPKQLLPLPYERTLIEQTLARVRLLTSEDQIWIVTLAEQVEETRKILPEFAPEQIIAEPLGRNTAPAAALATLWIEAKSDGLATLLLVPADAYIPDDDRFVATMKQGIACAERGESLVTFGLKVRSPRTDFGYIEVESAKGKGPARKVRRFIEKPPLAKAKTFAKSSRFFWNSGMFAWRSDFFQREMAQHAPKLFRPLQKLSWPEVSEEELRVVYPSLPSISIDYALMEKSKSVEVIPSTFRWSDVGTWAAVYEAVAKKPGENVVVGNGAVIDGSGNLVRSSGKQVVLMGVDDLVVIETPEATMVTTREKSRDLKNLLEQLERGSGRRSGA